MSRNTRRGLTLLLTAVTGLALLLTSCSSNAEDKGTPLASYSRGFSVVLTEQFADDGGVGDVSVKNYSDLQQLYTDLLSGRASMTIGGPDVFAAQAEKGAPVRLAATISPNSTAIVGKKDITSAADIKGTRVAAVSSSGGWHLTEAVLEKEFGVKAGDDYELVNVPDMASGTSQVVAGTADYVVGWEPSVNAALQASDDLKISYSVANAKAGETFGQGWQLVLAVREDVDQDVVDEVIAALQESAKKLQSDPAAADAYGVKFDFAKGTLEAVMDQSVQAFVVKPIDDEIRKELEQQIALVDGKLDPPDSFYGVGK